MTLSCDIIFYYRRRGSVRAWRFLRLCVSSLEILGVFHTHKKETGTGNSVGHIILLVISLDTVHIEWQAYTMKCNLWQCSVISVLWLCSNRFVCATNGYRGQWRVNNYKERICNIYWNTQPLFLGYYDVTLSANRIIWTNHGRCRFIFELPLSFVYYPLYTGKRSSLFHVCRFLCSGIVAWSCWVFPVLSRSRGCSVNKCKWDYRCGSHGSLWNGFLHGEKHGDLKACCGGTVGYKTLDTRISCDNPKL